MPPGFWGAGPPDPPPPWGPPPSATGPGADGCGAVPSAASGVLWQPGSVRARPTTSRPAYEILSSFMVPPVPSHLRPARICSGEGQRYASRALLLGLGRRLEFLGGHRPHAGIPE